MVLVGEMRDPETAALVLTLAETGHYILSTGHAPSATQAIEHIINMFPPHERYLAQTRLQIPNVIRSHHDIGMITLDEALVNHYLKGMISGESLLSLCNDRTEVEKLIGKVTVH